MNNEKVTRILDLAIIIFLGITSVFGAFAAYQSALDSSAMSKDYNEGIATITDANSMYVEAGQTVSNDMALYQNMVSLSLDVDYAKDSDEREKAEEKLDNFTSKFLSETLQASIEWAEKKEKADDAYVSPFDDENYYNEVYKEAQATYDEGRTKLDSGNIFNTNGDKMGLIVIYFATVLFLLGVCSSLKRNGLKVGLSIFSLAIFIFATVQMFQIPFLAP